MGEHIGGLVNLLRAVLHRQPGKPLSAEQRKALETLHGELARGFGRIHPDAQPASGELVLQRQDMVDAWEGLSTLLYTPPLEQDVEALRHDIAALRAHANEGKNPPTLTPEGSDAILSVIMLHDTCQMLERRAKQLEGDTTFYMVQAQREKTRADYYERLLREKGLLPPQQ
jgi:hypothetical protein